MIRTIVPMINTAELAPVREFYSRCFGFRVTFDSPMYLGIKHDGSGVELGFMIPETERGSTFSGEGVSFGFEVPDVDKAHAQLSELGAEPHGVPQDMPWGDRMFTLSDPTGLTLYVYQPGTPTEEFKQYLR